MNMPIARAERGYTLIVVMVLLTVLMVLGAGAIQLATSEVEGAGGYRRETAMAACAKAAKDAMISRLRFAQQIPQEFSLAVTDKNGNPVLDLADGHDPAASQAVIQDVEFVADAALGKGSSGAIHPRITNDIVPPGGVGNGTGARVTARCRDSVGRTLEVEFLVRYGI